MVTLFGWARFDDGTEVDLDGEHLELLLEARDRGAILISIGEEDIGDEARWFEVEGGRTLDLYEARAFLKTL